MFFVKILFKKVMNEQLLGSFVGAFSHVDQIIVRRFPKALHALFVAFDCKVIKANAQISGLVVKL